MSSKLFSIVVAAGLTGFMLQGCTSEDQKKLEAMKEGSTQQTATVTEVTTVQSGKLSSEIKIPGELQAFRQVDLYAKVNSYVKQMNVDIGSQVQQGQVLATMEAPEINSQLAASQSRLSSYEAVYIASKANYDRLLETSKTPGTISPNDLDMALARQKSDYAQLQAAKSSYNEVANNRDYLQIRAPFAGVITTRNASLGTYVGPSGKGSDLPMFTLQTQQQLRLAVAVPEAYTGFLNNNSEVSFTVASRPGQIFKAQVKRLAGALDQRLRSERIEMDVPNTDKQLLPGMVAEIIIPLPANQNTLIVPATAVVGSTEKTAVIKVVGGKAVWIDVKPGRTADKKTEVFGDLKAGDTIILAATEEIRDGMTVGKTKTN